MILKAGMWLVHFHPLTDLLACDTRAHYDIILSQILQDSHVHVSDDD